MAVVIDIEMLEFEREQRLVYQKTIEKLKSLITVTLSKRITFNTLNKCCYCQQVEPNHQNIMYDIY